jgi:hypothetical protein
LHLERLEGTEAICFIKNKRIRMEASSKHFREISPCLVIFKIRRKLFSAVKVEKECIEKEIS